MSHSTTSILMWMFQNSKHVAKLGSLDGRVEMDMQGHGVSFFLKRSEVVFGQLLPVV